MEIWSTGFTHHFMYRNRYWRCRRGNGNDIIASIIDTYCFFHVRSWRTSLLGVRPMNTTRVFAVIVVWVKKLAEFGIFRAAFAGQREKHRGLNGDVVCGWNIRGICEISIVHQTHWWESVFYRVVCMRS